jgi:diadenosine tetraphosphate (Ap4A) HIT family hydrolase
MSACAGCAKSKGALQDPAALVRDFEHSVLLLGDHQAYPGYCVLWAKAHVKELHHLEPAAYEGFLRELKAASQAVEAVTGCWKLNTVILGNVVPHLHVHLFPRSAMDPEKLEHPWVHAADFKQAGTPQQRQAMIARLQEALG